MCEPANQVQSQGTFCGFREDEQGLYDNPSALTISAKIEFVEPQVNHYMQLMGREAREGRKLASEETWAAVDFMIFHIYPGNKLY